MNYLKKWCYFMLVCLLAFSQLPGYVFAEMTPSNAEVSTETAQSGSDIPEQNTNEESVQKTDLNTNESVSDQNTEEKPIVSRSFPTGNYSGDFSLDAQKESIEAGQMANFNLFLKITGPSTSYTNAQIKIDLPTGAHFDQNLSELAINNVAPTYDRTNHQLTYRLGTINSGFSQKIVLKLKTDNGYTINGTELHMKGVFSADNLSEKVEENAQTTVTASATTALSNNFDVTENSTMNTPAQGETGIWTFALNIPKKQTGTLFIKENSTIIVKYTLDDHLEYRGVTNGTPEPDEINGQELIWKIAAPSYTEQAAADVLLNKSFQVRTYFKDDTPNFTNVSTKAEVTTEFIGLAASKVDTSNASVAVSTNSPEEIPPTVGNVFAPAHRAPVDANWGIATVTGNPDIKVYDSAKLGFALMLNSAMNDSITQDFLYYDAYYKMDDHLNLEQFYSGNFYFRPNTGFDFGKLKTDPQYNLLVKYDDDTEWTLVKEDVPLSTMFTKQQLGLEDGKHVSDIWIHFTHAPAGMYGTSMNFYTTVQDGYVGQVKNEAEVRLSGADQNGRVYYFDGTTSVWPDVWANYMAPRTVQILPKPTGTHRFVQGFVNFADTDGNLVNTGDNTVNVRLGSNKASISRLNAPFESFVLLPTGVALKEATGTDNFSLDLVSDNFNGTGQSLVKVRWKNDRLLPDEAVTAAIPVVVSKDAVPTLRLEMFGFIGDEEFGVPAITGQPTLSDTTLETDSNDLNGNGKLDDLRIRTANQYLLNQNKTVAISKLVKGNRDSKFSTTGHATTDSEVAYQLQLKNETDAKISDMVLMDVLPSVGDKGITDLSDRNSRFDMLLTGPLEMPDSWRDKVTVKYSTSKNPKRSGVLDKYTQYPATAAPLVDPVDVDEADFVTADQVADWTAIHSFILELKDGVEWTRGSNITIDFTLRTPSTKDIATELLDQAVPANERAAYNSFALAANGLQATEPGAVAVLLDDSVSPVTVRHIDQNTKKEIAASETLTGEIGDAYKATAKNISGYKLVKTPANVSGKISFHPQTVIFEYAKQEERGTADTNNNHSGSGQSSGGSSNAAGKQNLAVKENPTVLPHTGDQFSGLYVWVGAALLILGLAGIFRRNTYK
ncbi:MucBP domain-containing protein [Listeria costaricensis]|uniref:MucBP domain-containing protein n=1 Tax=Listeria costaricensis TaxID=2026604 RepID=UPI0013C4F2D4|nr:MucBP domain-containing protein [Listeria costaricensis]